MIILELGNIHEDKRLFNRFYYFYNFIVPNMYEYTIIL